MICGKELQNLFKCSPLIQTNGDLRASLTIKCLVAEKIAGALSVDFFTDKMQLSDYSPDKSIPLFKKTTIALLNDYVTKLESPIFRICEVFKKVFGICNTENSVLKAIKEEFQWNNSFCDDDKTIVDFIKESRKIISTNTQPLALGNRRLLCVIAEKLGGMLLPDSVCSTIKIYHQPDESVAIKKREFPFTEITIKCLENYATNLESPLFRIWEVFKKVFGICNTEKSVLEAIEKDFVDSKEGNHIFLNNKKEVIDFIKENRKAILDLKPSRIKQASSEKSIYLPLIGCENISNIPF